MVNISNLEEDEKRSKAGMNKKNVIVDPKVLRKELLKIYYAKDVNIIMKVVRSCDMKKPKKKSGKKINLLNSTEDNFEAYY